jgi:hypothetical protein
VKGPFIGSQRRRRGGEGKRSASELSFNLFGLDIELGRGVDKAPS